jgi:hypothetical protein
LDRNCEKYHYVNLKSNFKGKLVYNSKISTTSHNGVQREILSHLNHTETSHDLEVLALNDLLRDNLNFYCNFFLRAPRNHFIHLEFNQLSLEHSKCEQNNIRLYSNFTQTSLNSLESYYSKRPNPFIRLCSAAQAHANHHLDYASDKNMVVAEFYEESIANSSFSCQNAQNRICFLTSDLKHELNKPALTNKNENDRFFNQLIIELQAKSYKKFYFEIRYFFYRLDSSSLSSLSTNSITYTNSESKWKNFLRKIELTTNSREKNQYEDEKAELDINFESDSYSNRQASFLDEHDNFSTEQKCQFKCFNSHSEEGDDGDELNKKLFNTSYVCLDESLVCDGDVQCIFNDADEANCPFKLNSKTILIVLCTLFCFTLTVLLIFYFYRKVINLINSIKEPTTVVKSQSTITKSNSSNHVHHNLSHSKNIKYKRASQIEPHESDIDIRP